MSAAGSNYVGSAAAPGPESVKIAKRKLYDAIVEALPSEVFDELYNGRSKQELQECEDEEDQLCKSRIDKLTLEQLKKIAFTAARAVTVTQKKGLDAVLTHYNIEYYQCDLSKEWMYSLSFSELKSRIKRAYDEIGEINASDSDT